MAVGERAGQRIRRRLIDPQEGLRTGRLCFATRGFSLHAADRKQIVPGPSEEGHSASGHEEESAERRTYRLSWCVLLGRVFQVDVTVCPDCGGAMKIVAALTEAASIRSYLLGVGLPCRAPPVAPAHPDPQPQFEPA